MKKLTAALVCALVAAAAFAADEDHAKKSHPLLDQLKPLAGTWEGSYDGATYRTIYTIGANGSAIIEELMPDSARMLNVIHADGDALMMTHYCAAYNQPRYRATALKDNKIVFSFVDGTNLGPNYMAGVTLTMKDADHLTQEWVHRSGDKDEVVTFEFTRLNSKAP